MEQNNGADQVNSAVQNLNQIIQQNAAIAEEMAANSQELHTHADLMINTVSFFEINQKETASNVQDFEEDVYGEEAVYNEEPLEEDVDDSVSLSADLCLAIVVSLSAKRLVVSPACSAPP